MSEGVIGIDRRGIINSCNAAARRIFGYEAGEMIGRNIGMLMPEPDSAAHGNHIRRYLDTGEARIIGVSREVVGLRKVAICFRWCWRSEK